MISQTPEEKREKKRIQNANYRAAHREEIAAKHKIWRDNNQEHIQTKATERYLLHGEEMRLKAREHDHAKRAADPEGERAKVRKRYSDNPEPSRARCRKRRAENPELFSEQERARRDAEPEKHQAWDHTKRRRRRAAKASAPINDLTDEQWQEVLIAFQFRCAYCPPNCWRCRQKKHKLAQDHISPLGPEGPHTLHNIVPACQSCNSKKHTGPPLCPVQPLLLTIASSKKPTPRSTAQASLVPIATPTSL